MAASTSKPPSKPVQALKRYERQIKNLPVLLVNRRCFCFHYFYYMKEHNGLSSAGRLFWADFIKNKKKS
jgi:hypothetical protein